MFQALRKRIHLTPTTVIATLALVFAMTGGAYAASRYVITSTKQIKPSVLKALTGKVGPAGKNGVNGTNGTNGAQGEKGANGAAGTNGTNGTNGIGTQGETGATGAKGATGPMGPQGVAGATGPTGPQGPTGQSGFTETLPAGNTEKGDWSLVQTASGAFYRVATAVSFVIPLAAAPTAHYIRTTGKEPFYNATPGVEKEEEQTSAACKGSATNPEATSGNLCIYASGEEGAPKNIGGSDILPQVCPLSTGGACALVRQVAGGEKFGFGLETLAEAAGEVVNIAGTWAVTG